jgi:uncharacterized RDD family membrane protein YckC
MTETLVMGSPPLDTIITVSTPENVAFGFRLAGPFYRFLAMLIDLTLLGVVLFAFAMALSVLGEAGIGLLLFLVFFAWWGYGGLMETFFNGQTLGKKALGIRVVSESGLAINAGQAILRNVLRGADLIPPFFPGVASMLITSRFQRLGDLAAETIVVIDGGRSDLRPPRTNQRVEAIWHLIPARYRPDSSLVDALAAYVGSRDNLSVSRRRELAQPLASHFIRIWGLPPKSDSDLVLCAIYSRATMDQVEVHERRAKRTNHADVEILDE